MKTFSLLCVVALSLLCTSHLTTAGAVTLLDDTFDSENGGVGQVNFFNFTNWNVLDGSVDLLGNGFIDFYPGDGLYLDLDGTTTNGATLESKNVFSFNQDDSVMLTFDLAGSCSSTSSICRDFPNFDKGNNEVTVSLGSLFEETFSLNFDEPYQSTGVFFETITQTIPVGVPTTGPLVFAQAGGDNIGLILDNVKLDHVRIADQPPTVVPEPSTQWLFITSLVALGLLRWFGGRKANQSM